jgi:multidrug efflux pump subunit AcrA (membrane-fusion protein)
MAEINYLNGVATNALLLEKMALQQELIETQRKLIEAQKQALEAQKQALSLQKKLNKLTPKNPKDEDVFWHIASQGVRSLEAAQSDDLATVQRFGHWIDKFGEKYIKPHVSPKVYIECHNQMSRGLPERIAELRTKAELQSGNNGHSTKITITPIR